MLTDMTKAACILQTCLSDTHKQSMQKQCSNPSRKQKLLQLNVKIGIVAKAYYLLLTSLKTICYHNSLGSTLNWFL